MINNSIFKLLLFIILGALVTFSACDSDDENPDPGPPEPTNKTTGFVISVITPNSTSLVKYFDSIPSGTANISDGIDFQQFNVQDAFNNALYLQNTDGTFGLSKMIVDENGDLQVESSFTTGDRVDPITIRDAQTGVYFDYGSTQSVTVFNPTDMTITGSIDMSGALFPRDEATRYREFYVRDNLVFAPLASDANPTWYNPLVIHVADIDAGQFETDITIQLQGAVRHNQFFGGRYEDENGNLYITDQGDLLSGTPARLHRINNGATDFDPDFELDLAGSLNAQNLFYRVFNGFYYIGSGQAIASVTADTPAEVLAILALAGFNPGNLTNEQLVQIQLELEASENAAWCVIDLNSGSVTAISGIPSQNVNHRFTITEADGKWYLPVETSTEIAYYSYDPATGATAKAFDVEGGTIGLFINIANNN